MKFYFFNNLNIFVSIPVLIFYLSCKSNNKVFAPGRETDEPPFYARWIRNIPLIYPSVSDFEHDNQIYETDNFMRGKSDAC